MKFTCDQCGTRYSIADEKVERKILKIRCKVCKFVMVVRGSDRTDDSMGSLSSQFGVPPEIEWYVAISGQQHGPMPIERVQELIQEHQLSEDDLVWNENLTEWKEASEVPEIAGFFRKAVPAAPPPLPELVPPPLPSIPSIPPAAFEAPSEDAPWDQAGLESSVREVGEPETAQSISGSLLESLSDGDPSTSEISAPTASIQGRPVSDPDTLAYGSQDGASASVVPASVLKTDDEMTLMEDGASLVSQLMTEPDDPDELALADTGQAPEVGEAPGPTLSESGPLTTSEAGDSVDSLSEPLFPVGLPPTPSLEPEDTPSSAAVLTEPGRMPPSEPEAPSHQIEVQPSATLNIADSAAMEATPIRIASDVSVATTQRDAPDPSKVSPSAKLSHDEKKTSMGLVVAGAMCAAAALFCVFWFGMRGSDAPQQDRALKASTSQHAATTPTAAVKPSSDPGPSVDAGTPDSSTPKDAQAGKAIDATAPDPDAQPRTKSASPQEKERRTPGKRDAKKSPPDGKTKSTRKNTARTSAKKKDRRTKKSNILAGSDQTGTKRAGRRGRSSLFSGGPSPSAVLPAASRKEEDKAAGLTDGLNQAEVVKVISQYKKGLDGCYQRQLKREPLRDGRLMLKFRIRPSGRTSNVSIGRKYDGTVLKSCLDALVRRWRFPQFRGEPIDIEYPLIFATRF